MKVIFVCTGNTCRSPMAEGYLKSLGIPFLEVESRGLFTNKEKISDNADLVLKENGINMSGRVSVSLSRSDLDADVFIFMTKEHEAAMSPYNLKRTFTLNVSDPFGGSISRYRECFAEIKEKVNGLVFGSLFPFSVCPADDSFIKDIALLEKECFSSPWSENAIKESMNASTLFFVARQNETVLGYGAFSYAADEGYITNIAVSKAWRSRGIGTLILCRLCEKAKSMGLSFISLEVRQSNLAAISLYNSMGFNTEGRRKRFYTLPTEDAIIMTKRFKKE